MITFTKGNLLDAKAEALINTVNAVGVMGKGVALQFRQAYPEMFRAYEKACKMGQVRPGRMHVFYRGTLENPKYIINFPTKRHWKGKSRIEDIESGLKALIREVSKLKIRSIALPPLGCGNGGLNWNEVRPRIERAMATLKNVQVTVFEPGPAPKPDEIAVHTDKPAMSRGRALVVLLLERYFIPGYRISLLEIQKLVYFLQQAGQDLRLRYVRDKYGPYADTLHHVLQRMEGHYIRGYGDRTVKSRTEIMLLPGAASSARAQLRDDPQAAAHLQRVADLIQGFESPYGMELLATVHWLSKEFPEIAQNPTVAISKLRDWSTRKAALFREVDIEAAWKRLSEGAWFDAYALSH
jgi:O-acetyl-ADP-ribose deacetylase (regulator of RNase III)